jgi:hypothetical protein
VLTVVSRADSDIGTILGRIGIMTGILQGFFGI